MSKPIFIKETKTCFKSPTPYSTLDNINSPKLRPSANHNFPQKKCNKSNKASSMQSPSQKGTSNLFS